MFFFHLHPWENNPIWSSIVFKWVGSTTTEHYIVFHHIFRPFQLLSALTEMSGNDHGIPMGVRNGLRTSQKTTFGEEWRDDIFRNQSLYHRFLVVGRDGNRMSYMIFTSFLTERVPGRIFKIYSTGTSGLVLIRVQMKMFHLLTLANGIRVGLRGWGDVPTPSPLKGSWIFLQGKNWIPVPAGWIKEKSNLGLPNHKYYLLVLSNSILDTLGIYPLSHNAFLQGVVIK